MFRVMVAFQNFLCSDNLISALSVIALRKERSAQGNGACAENESIKNLYTSNYKREAKY